MYARSARPWTAASMRPGMYAIRRVCPASAYSSPSFTTSPPAADSMILIQRCAAQPARSFVSRSSRTPPRTFRGRSNGGLGDGIIRGIICPGCIGMPGGRSPCSVRLMEGGVPPCDRFGPDGCEEPFSESVGFASAGAVPVVSKGAASGGMAESFTGSGRSAGLGMGMSRPQGFARFRAESTTLLSLPYGL